MGAKRITNVCEAKSAALFPLKYLMFKNVKMLKEGRYEDRYEYDA